MGLSDPVSLPIGSGISPFWPLSIFTLVLCSLSAYVYAVLQYLAAASLPEISCP